MNFADFIAQDESIDPRFRSLFVNPNVAAESRKGPQRFLADPAPSSAFAELEFAHPAEACDEESLPSVLRSAGASEAA